MRKFYFTKKAKNFAEIVILAKKLEAELSWVPNCNNGMDRIIEFFQSVSSAQDKVTDLIKDFRFKNEKEKFIFGFLKFFENAGRQKHGWNRTDKGQNPCSSNVFIGLKVPYDEMFLTRSVAEHLNRRNNPKGEVDFALKEDCKGKWNETGLIEHEYVNPFMKKNYEFLRLLSKEF